MAQTWLWPVKVWTQDLGMAVVLWVPWVERWGSWSGASHSCLIRLGCGILGGQALFYIPQAIPKFPFQALWWGGCILPVWEAIDILMPVPWVGVFVCNCAWMGGACIESSAWMSGQRVTYSNFAMQRDDRCYWLLEVLIFWLICVNEQHKLCVMQL